MAVEELITLYELRGKLAYLRDISATAKRELEEVKGRSESITSLGATWTLHWRATKPSQWRC
jgi:hypothetical protein